MRGCVFTILQLSFVVDVLMSISYVWLLNARLLPSRFSKYHMGTISMCLYGRVLQIIHNLAFVQFGFSYDLEEIATTRRLLLLRYRQCFRTECNCVHGIFPSNMNMLVAYLRRQWEYLYFACILECYLTARDKPLKRIDYYLL